MRRRSFLQSCLGAIAGIEADALSHNIKKPLPGEKPESRKNKNVYVKVIGTAQDGGIPHMGCFCANCQRAWEDPRFSRLISSLVLIDRIDNKSIIVDTTPDIRAQTRIIRECVNPDNENTKFIPDGILLTHAHIGHYTGLMFYGYEAQSADRIPVYCSERMKSYLANNGPWSQLIRQKNIAAKIIRPGNPAALTSHISLSTFRVPHRDEFTDTLGFAFTGPEKSLLYIPDIQSWEAWDRSIVEEIQKVDIALLDGTFYSPAELPSRNLASIGHPFIADSIKTLKDVAQNKKVQVLFTHLNHSNLALDPEGPARKAIKGGGFDLAEEGMEFSL
jgi:pyrroloquinoline quinone biosynthesis protein B